MKKKYLYLIIFVFSNQLIMLAQVNGQDKYQKDTAQINNYITICKDLIYINPDSASTYIDTILSLSKEVNYEYGLYNSYNLNGVKFWMSNDLDQAIDQFRHALLYANSPDEPRLKALVLSNMGLIYSTAYKSDSAIYYLNRTMEFSKNNNVQDIYTKALFDLGNHYLEQDNYIYAIQNLIKVKNRLLIDTDSILLIYLYSTFGVLYTKVNNFDSSYNYYKKAIALDKQQPTINNIANNYINIGQLFFSSGKNTDSSMYYYRKAVSLALPYNKSNIEMAANINTGNIFLKKLQLDSAKTYYQTVLDNPLIHSYPNREAALKVNMGIYYYYNNNYSEARTYLEDGYKMADELDILLYKKNALKQLIKLDSATGRFKQVMQHYRNFQIISDSLQSAKASNELAVLEFNKYQEQQSYNNQILLNENKLKGFLNWLSLLAIFILLLLLFLLIRNRIKIKRLLKQLSDRHIDLRSLNEELTVTNEVLNTQQEQLKALNITKDKFFSILGHDLKSPFNSLLGLINLIIKDWEIFDDAKKHSLLKSLYSSSEKTYHLLEDLLDWGKAQQGLIKYKPEIFLLYPKIQVITDLFEAQLKNKQQQLTINVSPELTINTDIRLFSQIMQNFLNNAIKYTHKGGSITIEAETINGKIHLCVIDTGIGIPNDKISSLFDLDSEFNRPGTDKEQSTGMGLILSKEYAELMNAKLTVSSIEEKGSKFCLIIDTSN